MGNRRENSGNSVILPFLGGGAGGTAKSPQMVISAMKLKDIYSLEGKL